MTLNEHIEILAAKIRELGALRDGAAAPSERLPVPLSYPTLFQELLKNHSFANFEIGPVWIFSNLTHEADNLKRLLADQHLVPPLVKAGFLPLGRYNDTYNPICFDVRRAKGSDDSPVVFMEHESILSFDTIPDPIPVADSLWDLFNNDHATDTFERHMHPTAACPFCGKSLYTVTSQSCPHCFMDWRDPNNVRQLGMPYRFRVNGQDILLMHSESGWSAYETRDGRVRRRLQELVIPATVTEGGLRMRCRRPAVRGCRTTRLRFIV